MRSSAFALTASLTPLAMRHPSDPPDVKLVVLLVLGAVGLALVAVGVGTAAGWALIVPGCLALLVSLAGAWLIQRSRDKSLR